MISFPQIRIRQQFARIGMDADLPRIEQRQPKADMEIRRENPKLHMTSPRGELEIDQSRAWAALGLGGILDAMNRIYGQVREIFLMNLQRKVEQGNRLTEIHTGVNAIAENARELLFRFPEIDYYGPASSDNVDIRYTARQPEIEVEPGTLDIQVRVNRPELVLHRGKLDIYMQQYAHVEIIPPQIDLRV